MREAIFSWSTLRQDPMELGLTWIEGPRDFKLDLSVIKRVRIMENKDLEFRRTQSTC